MSLRARLVVALTVPVLAGGLAIGVGPAQASPVSATATRSPSAGVAWHDLTLVDGWHSEQTPYSTGAPAWAVRGGVVYLSGSIGGGGSSYLVTVLPPQARPAHTMWLVVYTLDDTTGELKIFPNGKMYAYSSATGNAHGFLSLTGLSYPAGATPQTKLALRNGWHSEQSAWNSGDPSYSVRGGVVYLSGALATKGSTGEFAVLPKAARPKSVEYFAVYTEGDLQIGTVRIEPSGGMFAYNGLVTDFTSLAGLSYPVASASSHKLTLLNGWHSEQSRWDSGDPAYRVSNGVVYLSGSLATSGTNWKFASLPAGVRPAHNLYIKVYTYGGTTGTVRIFHDGELSALSPTATDAEMFTSLASISFPLSS